MNTETKWLIAEIVAMIIASAIGTAGGVYMALWQNGLL